MRATWTCLVGLEHHGVVSGGEQASEVRGGWSFSCGKICPLDLISGTQRRVKKWRLLEIPHIQQSAGHIGFFDVRWAL